MLASKSTFFSRFTNNILAGLASQFSLHFQSHCKSLHVLVFLFLLPLWTLHPFSASHLSLSLASSPLFSPSFHVLPQPLHPSALSSLYILPSTSLRCPPRASLITRSPHHRLSLAGYRRHHNKLSLKVARFGDSCLFMFNLLRLHWHSQSIVARRSSCPSSPPWRYQFVFVRGEASCVEGCAYVRMPPLSLCSRVSWRVSDVACVLTYVCLVICVS